MPNVHEERLDEIGGHPEEGTARGVNFTPQQEAIFAAWRDSAANVLVGALAGTGKTSTAVAGLSQGLPGRVGFVAFNNHIAKELQSRLPPSVPACTLHALGYAAVRKAFKTELDEQKLTKLAKLLSPDTYPSVRQAAEQLTRLCKGTLTNPAENGALASLVEHFGLEIDLRDRPRVFSLARQLLQQSGDQTSTVDFDDMVWFPHRHNLRPEQFDLLIVDEAQDLNRAQQALAKSATASGRLCPVGDRNQAIYGFSGADCEALPRLGRDLDATILPLTVTWRCPQRHVTLARRIVPELEAAPDAAEGVVRHLSRKEITAAARPGDLIICRRNAPVVGMAYKLVLAGVPAMMRGRDIGKGMTALIRRLKPVNIRDLIDKVAEFHAREERRLMRQDAPQSAMDSLNDRCECLGQLAAQVKTLGDLERFISERFDDQAKPGTCVVLSSVHRAKGLEAARVTILDAARIRISHPHQKPWQQVQEANLHYIALTRSKDTMTFETDD